MRTSHEMLAMFFPCQYMYFHIIILLPADYTIVLAWALFCFSFGGVVVYMCFNAVWALMLWSYIPQSWSCTAHESRVLRNLLALSLEEGLMLVGRGRGRSCLRSYGTQYIRGDAGAVHELHGAGSWIYYFLSIRVKLLNLSLDFHIYKITVILVFTSLGPCECWIRSLMWRVWCLLHTWQLLRTC